MGRIMDTDLSVTPCATIVIGDAVTKPEALAAVAAAVGGWIERSGTARPFVRVGDEEWAEVEVPKFGEAPPLAIDVYSTRGLDEARERALHVMALLAQSTPWDIRPMFAA